MADTKPSPIEADAAPQKPAEKPAEKPAATDAARAKPAADANPDAARAKPAATDAAGAKPAAVANPDAAELPDDPDALKAEVERLRAENEVLASAHAPHHFWRNASAAVLIVLGVILFAMAVSAVWLNRTIMDENRWVTTVAPLAQNADIQKYVADQATAAIFNNVDIQSYVKQALAPLPPAAQFLVVPTTGAIQNFVREAATKVTQSQQFFAVWVRMNRAAHKAFIAAITNKPTGILQKSGGTITLDVSTLIDQVKAALSARGLGFVNNINIPVANQQITLYNSPVIDQLGQAIQLMNTAAYVLPILALLFLAGGVALAVNRQKAVLWLGVGIIVATILPIQAIYLGQAPFAKAALELGKMPAPAAQAAYSIVFRNLIQAERLLAVVGLIFLLGALIAGPSRWATSLRGGFSHGLANIGPDWDFGPAGEWVFLHRSGVRTAGIIAAILALIFIPGKTIWTLVWLLVFVIVWIALVAFFGRPRPVLKPAETSPASGGKDSALPAT